MHNVASYFLEQTSCLRLTRVWNRAFKINACFSHCAPVIEQFLSRSNNFKVKAQMSTVYVV